jgi:hypothetical protein
LAAVKLVSKGIKCLIASVGEQVLCAWPKYVTADRFLERRRCPYPVTGRGIGFITAIKGVYPMEI